jgi:hypothetical protein
MRGLPRKALREWLVADPALTAVVPAARWVQRGAVVDIPSRPYVVLADLGTDVRGTGVTGLFGVYVHDDRGSYLSIDDLLDLVKSRMESVQQFVGTDGRIVEASWQGHSEDVFDDPTNTNVKNSTYRVVGVKN